MINVSKPWVKMTLKILTVLFAIAGLIGTVGLIIVLGYADVDAHYFITRGLIFMALESCSFLSIGTFTIMEKGGLK